MKASVRPERSARITANRGRFYKWKGDTSMKLKIGTLHNLAAFVSKETKTTPALSVEQMTAELKRVCENSKTRRLAVVEIAVEIFDMERSEAQTLAMSL